jgi:hypothetical protein
MPRDGTEIVSLLRVVPLLSERHQQWGYTPRYRDVTSATVTHQRSCGHSDSTPLVPTETTVSSDTAVSSGSSGGGGLSSGVSVTDEHTSFQVKNQPKAR